MSRRAIIVLLVVLTAGAAVAVSRSRSRQPIAPAGAGAKTIMYQCAMHPQIVSDKPGVCPICQMRLMPVEEGAPAAIPAAAGVRTPLFYRHPMRADVVSSVPAKDEMGMDYVPVYPDEVAAAAGDVPGHAPFTLSSERQQLIGVTRGRVRRRPLEIAIRAVGKVAYDPQLYQAIVEYREAAKAPAEVRGSPSAEAQEGASALLRAARLKLRRQGVSDAQVATLMKEGDPVNLLLPGKTVWVYAQVYEYELELVHPGQTMTITVPSLPGRSFSAAIVGVDPIVNAATRTVRVRALVATPDADLRPETFVDVHVHVPLGERLAVPEDAVLDTGERQIVFVVRGEGSFEPRAVRLGRQAEGHYEVLAGLEEGDEVVTSANFLIDSESRFRAALAAFRPAAPGHGRAASGQ